MSVFVLLDILLLILIALFVPIGFWRGAQREALVTLGILFGAALGDAWAHSWGNDLANLTRLRPAGGAFMIAVLFLIGSAFLLGYGSGAALPAPRPGILSRFLGGLIAGGNGALLLSYALRDIRVYLLQNQSPGFLDNALVAHFLASGAGWLLLVAAIVFVPIVVILALFGRGTYLEELQQPEDAYEVESPELRSYPPRVPVMSGATNQSTAAYKAESPRPPDFLRVADETRPVHAGNAQQRSLSWGGSARNDSANDPTTFTRVEPSRSSDAQKTVQLQVQSSGPTARTKETESLPVRDGKCPNCHADVRDAEVYCPRCGRVL